MPFWLLQLVGRSRFAWRRVPWARVWIAALWLFQRARDRVQKNLSAAERKELMDLMRKSKGRQRNLSNKEQERFRRLVRKAATGN